MQPTLPETPPDSGTSSLSDDTADDTGWLNVKLAQSQQWLGQAERGKMSIQVMMRNKSGVRELVYYLRNEWPLDLSQTYVYEVTIEGRSIYRVFYSEYDSLNQARAKIDELPESVRVNSPYVHSVHRMRKALL
jgi:septal ring-binding cell division protein DamX